MVDTHELFDFNDLNIDLTSNKFSASWSVSSKLPYFEGHFPNNPILPAIALFDLSEVMLEQGLKKPIKFKTVSSAKFLVPIIPRDKIKIELSLNEKSQNWSGVFTNQENKIVCKLSFSLLE